MQPRSLSLLPMNPFPLPLFPFSKYVECMHAQYLSLQYILRIAITIFLMWEATALFYNRDADMSGNWEGVRGRISEKRGICGLVWSKAANIAAFIGVWGCLLFWPCWGSIWSGGVACVVLVPILIVGELYNGRIGRRFEGVGGDRCI